MFGYYRLASAVPQLRVADVDYNVDQLMDGFRKAAEQKAAAVVFPELSITGYSCGDLFFQPRLREAALDGLRRFAEATEGSGTIAVAGLPFLHEDALYNTAAVIQSGRVLALIPKTVLPNYREFYEKRQFTSGRELGTGTKEAKVNGAYIPFGTEIIFHDAASSFSFGVEICEDLWSVIPPSSGLALQGARAIFNPSAGTELTGKAAYRRELVKQQSGRCLCSYVLSSAGVHESTTDTVFGGHSLIADNGRLAAEGERFGRESSLILADVDFERLAAARLSESSFNDSKSLSPAGNALHLTLPAEVPAPPGLEYAFNPARPFLPSPAHRPERCEEIIAIQTAGLAKRMEHTDARRLVIGISGGLDSTLALLICERACRALKRPASDILAVTLPGFGTWKSAVAAISGLVAKENVVATFGQLYHFVGEVAEDGSEIWGELAADFTQVGAYAFMACNLLCAPCFAAMGAIKREMNNGKRTAFAIGYMCAYAYVVSTIIYQIGGLITGELTFGVGTVVAIAFIALIIFLLARKPAKADSTEGLRR
uniref:nitrilase-related carbon-nitrogen hydrolase n=1 Tax=Akkermansia sp. TaxID=1872421 RepID=UPI003FD73FE6